MAEIVKRRAEVSFTEKNVQTVVLNVVALIATFITSAYTLNMFVYGNTAGLGMTDNHQPHHRHL